MPPHEPVYQYQSDPVPKIPPINPKVVESLSHIVANVAVTELAIVELICTIISLLRQPVVLQYPSPLTKYIAVVVGVRFSVTPLPMDVPEQPPLYQYQLPPLPKIPPVTLNVVEPPIQRVDNVDVIELAPVEPVFTSISLLAHVVVLHAFSALT